MKSSLPSPTKADKRRFQALQDLGCICCRKRRQRHAGWAEIHHILSGGKRVSHQHTLPLCEWHHRGTLHNGMKAAFIKPIAGPSLANGSKPFVAAFGTEMELLAEVNKLIGEVA